MTPTETRYAQIEKEALALTWACERFADYLVGLKFHVFTDHKPLVPLLGSKNLEELPLRVQRFRMRLMRFHYTISHIPGKELITADALSRAPVSAESCELESEVSAYISFVVNTLPATEKRLMEIRMKQEQDEVCSQIKKYCDNGWPDKKSIPGAVKHYLPISAELSVVDGLLMRGGRIVIPSDLRLDILDRLHPGHQGIQKCRLRARQAVWWPGMSAQLTELVSNCRECRKLSTPQVLPLLPTELPELPWQKVAMDLFEWKKRTYLLVVDYFSRYIEIARLEQLTAAEVIRHCKSIFARHGIPEQVISDNGPQFAADDFKRFAQVFGFDHLTSSPYYPQANGEAERAVKTIKSLLCKDGDPYLALLSYRATPLQMGFSPAELLMSRRLRTNIPMTRENRRPRVIESTTVAEKDARIKRRQKENFDKRHRAKERSDVSLGSNVWMHDKQLEGTVIGEAAPRSFEVETSEGVYRRNQSDLVPLPQTENHPSGTPHVSDSIPSPESADKMKSVRRSSRVVQPPDRLDPSWKRT